MVSRQLLAFVVAALVLAVAGTASAQDASPDTGDESRPQSALARLDRNADCQRKLALAETAIASDAHYAKGWTYTWTWVGASLFVLNLTQAYQVGDYRRGEALTFAGTSLLLMLPRPLALTSEDALHGLSTSGPADPCLALADARSILQTNRADGKEHRAWPNYVVGIVLNAAVYGILGAATGHWDFVGQSNLGLQSLIGAGLGALQVFTYPSGSLRAAGTSLEMAF